MDDFLCPDNSVSHFPTVGVIGAGQLARMMVAPAIALGVNLKVFAQSHDDSAAQILHHEVGDYRDSESLRNFAQDCDVITFEHELIPSSVISTLERDGIVVRPAGTAFRYSQNKAELRQLLTERNIRSPRWQLSSRPLSIEFPLVAKSISGGYDGRGVWVVHNQSELHALGASELLLEEKLHFSHEIAVMVARSPHGQISTWPATETIQVDGMCVETITPAPCLDEAQHVFAQQMAITIADYVGLIGVMAVEMFLVEGELVINEIAMRPHNSGHWSIEGSVTSQFEQHLRAILDLPLGDTSMRSPFAVMGNVVGGEKTDMYRPYLHLFARTPHLKIHQYRKTAKPGRKVGHVTAVGNNLDSLREEVRHAVGYMNGAIDE